ncbi:MAG: tetratricopeptide repeat protein [Myxococcota bacterium]|nr:tetratricopeptide repeat protein [Myxococcota bacterium]
MKIVCPSCGADYRISEGKVPADGLVIKCPSCLVEFRAFVDATTLLESEVTGATEPPPLPAPEMEEVPAPPPPPDALEDDFHDFNLSDDDDFFGDSIDGSPEDDAADSAREEFAPPPPADQVGTAKSDLQADDFDFNFGASSAPSAPPAAGQSPLGDLFDDLDDLPAPKDDAKNPLYEDLPAPRKEPGSPLFSEVSDLPGLKVDQPPIGAPEGSSRAAPELLLAPEDEGEAPELPSDDDARFFAATGSPVSAAPMQAQRPVQQGSRKSLWIALAVMVLVGVGVGGLMIMEVGPFATDVSSRTRSANTAAKPKAIAKTKPARKKKVAKAPTQVEKTADSALGTLKVQAPTLAEISGYRSAIAAMEPNRKTLSTTDLVALGELYAFGALEYPENAQWVQSAGEISVAVKASKTPVPGAQKLALAAKLSAGDKSVVEGIKALADANQTDAKAQMLLGYARLAVGDSANAYGAFKKAFTLNPKLSDAELRAGMLALKLGYMDAARSLFENLYKKAPGAPRVNTALAALDFREGKVKRANRLLLQALTLESGRARAQDRSAAFVLRARISMKAGDLKGAVSDLRSAVRVWSANLEALNLLSERQFADGKYDEALAVFKELEQAGAKSPQTAIKIAECYLQMGQPERSLEQLEDALKRYNTSPDIHNAIGDIHAKAKDFTLARAAYDEALKIDKTFEAAQLSIAELLVKEAKVLPAIDYLKDALKANPNSALMTLGLANLRWQMAETSRVGDLLDQAEAGYRRALSLDPGLVEARRSLISVLIAKDDAKNGLIELQKLAQRTDFHGDMNYEFGRAKHVLGRTEEAIEHYRKAIDLQPNNVKYLQFFGVALFDVNRLDRAKEILEQAAKMDPKNQTVPFYLGRIAYEKKQFELAVQHFKQALELDKQDLTSRYWLGRALEATGMKAQRKAARQEYDLVAKRIGDNENLTKTLCDVFLRRGQMQQTSFREWQPAIAEFTKYIACNPKDANAHLYRGQIYEKLGQLDQAVADFNKATRKNPKLAAAYAANAYAQLRKPKPNEKLVKTLLRKAIRADKKLAYPQYLLCNMVKDRNKAVARRHCQTYLKLAPDGDYAAEAKDLLRSL